MIPISHDTLERVQEALHDRFGAELAFSHGNPGLMAAVTLPGDGSYEVYVDVDETAAGARLKSITIAVS